MIVICSNMISVNSHNNMIWWTLFFSIAHMEKLKLDEVCPSLYLVSVSAGFELESPGEAPGAHSLSHSCSTMKFNQ